MTNHGFHIRDRDPVPVLLSLAAAFFVGFAWLAAMFVIVTYGRF